ncbi:MAG: phosphoadenosine phosphosulfate reductase family protein [Verrucomicrobia bacterium]|nr:phosphoadenosine phosphosulfate reductase family protein [Verrucomicrobiota bacterium]MCH8526102.1 phosphoadenosine phosphosulfate reductase family protein [Kiritimatiellia bacterium]
MTHDPAKANTELADATPQEILRWAQTASSGNMMISTNFRPYEAVLLHLATQIQPDIPVLWVDHGYNTPQTYRCAEETIAKLNLNVHLYIPRRTAAHRDSLYGGIPSIDDEAAHNAFTEEVKLEPFRRGLATLKPKVWLTALRRVQNPHRETMDIVARTGDGILKVCPILDWTDEDMQAYIENHNLPNEFNYFDPTKVLEKRECGLHLDSAKL